MADLGNVGRSSNGTTSGDCPASSFVTSVYWFSPVNRNIGLRNEGRLGAQPAGSVLVPTNALVPNPCITLVAKPTVLAGQYLVGQCAGADTYTDYPLELRQDTAELIISVPVSNTIVVDVTGYVDLIGDTGTVSYGVTVSTTTTGYADLTGDTGDVFWQRNVIIPEPFTGDAICGKVICGVPPVLCGQNNKGDHYLDYAVDLDGGAVQLFIDVNFLIQVEDVIPLELDGGEHVIVNPVLMPFDCLDLDLAPIVCTPLEPEPLVCLEA